MESLSTIFVRIVPISVSMGLAVIPGFSIIRKNHAGQFVCRKSLHARFGNDNFSPTSTGRTKTKVKGVLAQLVERFNGIEEVSGSNPLCSTK